MRGGQAISLQSASCSLEILSVGFVFVWVLKLGTGCLFQYRNIMQLLFEPTIKTEPILIEAAVIQSD